MDEIMSEDRVSAGKRKKLERKKEQLIAKAVSDIYISMHLFDIVNDSYQELYAVPELHQILGESGGITAGWGNLVREMVRPEFVAGILPYTSADSLKKMMSEDRSVRSYEFVGMDSEWCRINFMPVSFGADGTLTEGICTVQRIDEEKKREIEYQRKLESVLRANEHLKYVDELTGCPNKKGFSRKVRSILKKNKGRQYGVCYSDICNLTYVNGTYGYEAGSQLLKYWSSCMEEWLGDGEVFGRVSGDCFVAFLELGDNMNRREEIEARYEEVNQKVNRFFQKYDRHFSIDIYSGLYLVMPEDIEEMAVDRMTNYASIAHQNARERGERRIVYFNEGEWEKRRRSIEISQHLTESLANGEIEAWLQPQFDYQDNKIVGAEVLSRWNSSFMGKIAPIEFIPVLEASGQIFELDLYIWEQACRYLRSWIDDPQCEVVPLSVNISRRDIMQEGLIEKLQALLRKYDLQPEYLRLEITESAYMDEPERLIHSVAQLQRCGFTIEMDDFGSGYSSLNMLKEVPVDVLKMDLHFLTKQGSADKGGNIISSVIRMAQGLDIAVIAEGVETEEQSCSLRNMGCYMMQGYYFARPMPGENFEKFLRVHQVGEKRGKTMDQGLTYIYDILDTGSRSSYIFNHYSGGSAILEFNGERLEVMSVNDEFLRTIGDRSGRLRHCMKDSLALVRESDRPRALDAVRAAILDGRAECELYYPETKTWVRMTFRHVFKSRSADYLFSEAVNTTEEHRLTAQVNNLMAEVNTQIDLLPVGAFRYEADGDQRFAFISDGMLVLLGYRTLEEFHARFRNFPEMIYWRDRERVLQEIDEQIAQNGSKDYCEYRIETRDGSLKWVYDHGRLVTDDSGKRWFYVVIADLDQVKKERMEKEWQERKYETFKMVPGISTFDYDIESDELTVNMTKNNGKIDTFIFESYMKKMEEKGWATHETAAVVRAAFERARAGETNGSFRYEGRFGNGRMLCYRCYYASVADDNGRVFRIVGNVANIENEAQEMSGWRDRAKRDEMTKLLNHDAFIEAMQECMRESSGGLLMMMDVDNFKRINDTKGHVFGDQILKKIANVLISEFRKSDLLGRFGGDEFMVFLPGVQDRRIAREKAESLMRAFGEIEIADGEVVHVSIGVAVDYTGTLSAEELVIRADTRLYEVKEHGKNGVRME